MDQHLSEVEKPQEQNSTKKSSVTIPNQVLHWWLHTLLALSLAFRYLFAKTLLPFSFELDYFKTTPSSNIWASNTILNSDQLELRLIPLLGFSFCLWIMISLFRKQLKKAWIYVLLIHAIPLMDFFGVMGSPWTGGVCCWVLAWRLHIQPFSHPFKQGVALLVIGFMSFWWSSLNFYLWPWLIFSFCSSLGFHNFKKWTSFSFYAYLILYQLISFLLIEKQEFAQELQFIINLWPVFLGPVAIIVSVGFFLIWGLRSIFNKDEQSDRTKELGLMCLLLLSALFMGQKATGETIEALLVLAFFIPFGLLYGRTTKIETWSIHLCYWSSLSLIMIALLSPSIQEKFTNSKFKPIFGQFKSWHLQERMSQDLSIRFWDVIESYQPSIIICDSHEMALQMHRHSQVECISLEEWLKKSEQKDIEYDLSRVFMLSKTEIPLSQRQNWFGKDLDWFLHKQWSLTIDITDMHTFYVYGSHPKKSQHLAF